MTDYPIIFSAKMIRALLDGRKTQTRRLAERVYIDKRGYAPVQRCDPSPWTKVKAGDRCYVRENFSYQEINGDRIEEFGGIHYWADGNPEFGNWTRPKPSIHLPRILSRITLIVAATKIERLQDITEDDARAEGAQPRMSGVGFNGVPSKSHRTGFVHLWGSLHGTDSWLNNPHVVAMTFRVISANIDSPEAKAA